MAVVPSSITFNGRTNFNNLKNEGICHPGFSATQWWNDYILKYFERKVVTSECRDNMTIAENELENLRNFFGKACRPGDWTSDFTFDQILSKFIKIVFF